MDDTIYRQDAFDALNGLTKIFLNNLPPTIYKEDAIKAVKALPPAQPECEDAVSRKAVIDAIDKWKEACADNGHKETVSDIKLIRKDFIELPSVTPKQPGWIPCSECEKRCEKWEHSKI